MRTALFFGSFNPIHIGHLAIANYITEFTEADELWFVVSPQNPLKDKNTLLPERQRFDLIYQSVKDYPKFRVSDIEFNLPTPSYTIHTLTHLSEKYQGREFLLVLGSDNLVHFHKWKNYDLILKNYRLLVYPRPDTPDDVYEMYPSVTKINAPQMDISSRFIREGIRAGKDMRFFLPPPAFKLIEEMNFYRK
jgi:nicotinate-nucleotide adenylyltransferase